MKITNLKINHYKTMEDPMDISCFSELQTLIGPNNSGKTNVLDAIELFFSPNLDPERFYDSHADLALTLSLEGKDTLKIVYKNDRRTVRLNGKTVTGRNALVQEVQKRIIRIRPLMSTHDLIIKDLKNFATNHGRVYKEFCSTLQQYFDDIEISEKLFLDNIRTDHHDRPVERLGSGFRRFFIMLFYIFHPDYDIILIDEAELHVHPSVIKRFLRILADTEFDNQVFLTTHSAVFVQPETVSYVWRVARDEHHNTKIYSLLNCETEQFTNKRLVQELNADNTEMFFAEKVLLVEGISDRILMRGLIDRFYGGKHDIKVVFTDGKGNIDIYVELCEAFHMPYMVMLDRDALRGTWARVISRSLKGAHRVPLPEKIARLKQNGIYILDGTLEHSYPRKYQKKDTKPLNALAAAAQITPKDLTAPRMAIIREILEKL